MQKIRQYKSSLFFLVIIILTFVNISCGRLSQKTAQEMFLEKNPTYKILHSETGERWDGVAYHQFEYKKPNDEKNYKEVWCFEQQTDGSWKVTAQWTPKE